jgi:uncharacterized protein YggE
MKHKIQTISVLLLIGLLLGAGIGAPNTTALAQANPPADNGSITRTVSVSAAGQVSSQPDTAVVTIGVQTDAEEAAAALTQNSQQMQSLVAAVRQAGVASADIQTQTIRLQPDYTTQQNQQKLSGFTAINTVQVRVSKLDNLGSLLDAAVQAGGNTINQIQFEISDTSQLHKQARQAAMQSAKEKASELAGLADAQLGPVVSINENSAVPQPYALGASAAPSASVAVPVEPGTQNVTVNVQVTWELIVNSSSGQGN